MKKINLVTACMILFFLINGCEKEDISDTKSIKIVTEKIEYGTDEMINITITNNLEKGAFHFKCDNYDLNPSHILKLESAAWKEELQSYLCTTMGPMGFIGSISPLQTKNDFVKIETMGKYKLKYTFIIDSDTTHYLSNEFKITIQNILI